jgi:hypothetical protein
MVLPATASSSRLVLPTIRAPAARSLATAALSSLGVTFASGTEPPVVGRFFVLKLSFIATGMQWRGRRAPRCRSSSSAFACSSSFHDMLLWPRNDPRQERHEGGPNEEKAREDIDAGLEAADIGRCESDDRRAEEAPQIADAVDDAAGAPHRILAEDQLRQRP